MSNTVCAAGCVFAELVSENAASYSSAAFAAIGNLSAQLPWFWPTAGFCFGATMASFIGMAAYRLPRIHAFGGHSAQTGLSLSRPRSHCDHCRRQLTAIDLIPVAGWVLAGGKCRKCNASISFIYPLVEFLTGFSFLFVFAVFGFTPVTLVLLLLSLWLLLVSWVDITSHEIPDAFTIPIALAGLSFSPIDAGEGGRAVAILLGAGLLYLSFKIVDDLKSVEAMSWGDILFAAAAGMWLGVCWIIPFLIIASVVYVAVALPLRMRGQIWVPMGPALSISLVATLVIATI